MKDSTFELFQLAMKEFGATYTNGAYEINGFAIAKTLYGVVVKSDYPNIYHVGQYVEMPMYHIKEHETDGTGPQFVKKSEYKK